MAVLPPNLNFLFHRLGIQPILWKIWPHFAVEGLNLNFKLNSPSAKSTCTLSGGLSFTYFASQNCLCMQYKHLFWGHLNRQHPTPLLKLKVLSLFWSWRTAVQKILEFPRKKLLRLCFLTPALSVLDTWMCCQHSDLPERNILLTRKYGSKNCKANRNYLLNFSTPKEIGCSGLLLFSKILNFSLFSHS